MTAGATTATAMNTDPVAVVQRQLEAYNARDLARFLAEYSDDVEVFRLPAAAPAIVGKKAFGDFYATQRFNHAKLHAELRGRMAFGSKVIDHERISGVRPAVRCRRRLRGARWNHRPHVGDCRGIAAAGARLFSRN